MKDKLTGPEILDTVELPFYTGIAENKLFFHGTNNIERLNNILKNGLNRQVNNSNLARRISFSSDPSYSGGYGFILGLEPKWEELGVKPSVFLQNSGFNYNVQKLSPDRIVFYLPDGTGLPRNLFNRTREIINNYFRKGLGEKFLLTEFSKQVDLSVNTLNEKAIIKDKSKDKTHKLAQQMVWNELCGYTILLYNEAEYYTDIIKRIRFKQNITTPSQLLCAVRDDSEFNNFDIQNHLNNLRLISNIGSIEGLGFEGLSYPIRQDVIETAHWLTTLKTPEPKTTDIIRDKLKSLFKR